MDKSAVYLPDEIVDEIKRASQSEGRSEEDIVRDAMDDYLSRRRRGLPSVFGKAKGRLFTAEESEDWLLENWRAE